MKEYLIDGNNLIHKTKDLAALQRKEPQMAREKLVPKLDRYFANKLVKVSLFFDGFENLPINSNKIRIHYSDKKPADILIRQAIEHSKNPKNLVVVSSDSEILNLARACSAAVIKSEEFSKSIKYREDDPDEKKIDESDNSEFRKLFGID